MKVQKQVSGNLIYFKKKCFLIFFSVIWIFAPDTVFEIHQKCRFEFCQGPKFALCNVAIWDLCDISKHCVLPCLLVLIIMIRDLGAAVNNGGNSKLLPTCIMTTLTKRHPPTVTWEMHLWLKLFKKAPKIRRRKRL